MKYLKYEDQDMRESIATKILKYLRPYLKIDEVFQKGWEDALIAGEEIYEACIISNEPVLRRCNPAEIYAILPHNEDILDEAEVITEETWMSISEVVDHYYEYLKPSEIDYLEEVGGDNITANNFAFIIPERQTIGYGDNIAPLIDQTNIYDPDGNIKVMSNRRKRTKGAVSQS